MTDQGVESLWHAVIAADQRRHDADVELWRFMLPRLDAGQLDEAVHLAWLTTAERAATHRMGTPEQRSRFASRRILRRLVAAARLERAPADVEITARCQSCGKSGHGQPHLETDQAGPLRMSTSSSGDRAVIAVSRAPLGVDIEAANVIDDITPDRVTAAIAVWNRVKCACPPGTTPTATWAALEALAKTTGLGLRASAQDVEHAIARHRLVWFADQAGFVTCVATSIDDAVIATIDIAA